MELYQVIFLVAIIILIISLFLRLIFSPLTWIIIGVLLIYSYIKRALYMKQLEDYNKQYEEELQRKKEAYQSGEAYRQGSQDIIDVNYTEKED